MKLKPLYDRVLIRRDDPTTELKGILIPNLHAIQVQSATVLAVGEGRINPEGKIIPLRIKKGDRILIGQYNGTPIANPDDPLDVMTVMIREEEILGYYGD